MSETVHDRIKQLIEGTHEAFETYGTMNTDYAEFASMAIGEFKMALENPDLTAYELRQLIRKGQSQRNTEDPQGCWATFMARYVSRGANNSNLEEMTAYTLEDIYKQNG